MPDARKKPVPEEKIPVAAPKKPEVAPSKGILEYLYVNNLLTMSYNILFALPALQSLTAKISTYLMSLCRFVSCNVCLSLT